MTDVVDKQTRSRMMSGIRGKNTRPELLIRRGLFAAGFRYRLHCKSLPSRPDIVIHKHRVLILVHGCFWHGHEGCRYFKLPAENAAFWKAKLLANRKRDRTSIAQLKSLKWRVAVVWECAVRKDVTAVVRRLDRFIRGQVPYLEIASSAALGQCHSPDLTKRRSGS